jgi:hypothetical protein
MLRLAMPIFSGGENVMDPNSSVRSTASAVSPVADERVGFRTHFSYSEGIADSYASRLFRP